MASPSPAIVARLTLPDDANPAGNVHGGTILRLMEEAGMIVATRYMSSGGAGGEASGQSGSECVAALVRFETMSFKKPVFVGEVASCHCSVVFTSERSILVEVVVMAEGVSKGMHPRVTNTGWLWYVPMVPGGGPGEEKDWNEPKVTEAPAFTPVGDAAVKKYDSAKIKYEARKKSQSTEPEQVESSDTQEVDEDEFSSFKSQYASATDGHTPAESEQMLCQMVMPSDCGTGGVAFGGFVMKMMDNAAGCSAFRHCRTNVVTVAISDMDMVSWIKLGDLCSVRSRAVFGSSKSLEIEVVASVASAASIGEETVVAKGLFTFVSIGADGKVLAIPKLRPETDEDMRKAYAGQKRYEAAKRARGGGGKK